MPKLTIITPVYCDSPEKEDWLIEAIESVQSQTIKDWEMIIVNDKSSTSLISARSEVANDERIRWFDLAENSGPSLARNLAAELAESDCLFPLDADDMLPEPMTLENMYDIWITDKSKIIYGNIQQYKLNGSGIFQRDPKIFKLPEYDFNRTEVMLDGAISVSAMHSIDCHFAAGGWKKILSHGLEDVEYWYAAGLAGFCGIKTNDVTLLYRKHNDSRTKKIQENGKLLQMQMKKMIIDLHSDPIKKGVYPMACCGGNKNNVSQAHLPEMSAMSQVSQGRITPLDGHPESELEWVKYTGPRKGKFDVLAGNIRYTIFGTGQVFQIHKSHRDLFIARQRHGFIMNQQDPRDQPQVEAIPEPSIQPLAQPFSPPSPQLPVVERLDHIAASTRQAQVVEHQETEIINEPHPSQFFTNFIPEKEISLEDLNISKKLIVTLKENEWTVDQISQATPQILSSFPGIGIKRANSLIDKARKLLLK